ncbi:hypothetical protein ACFLZB_02215 [Nanoarchaeota archaeon]
MKDIFARVAELLDYAFPSHGLNQMKEEAEKDPKIKEKLVVDVDELTINLHNLRDPELINGTVDLLLQAYDRSETYHGRAKLDLSGVGSRLNLPALNTRKFRKLLTVGSTADSIELKESFCRVRIFEKSSIDLTRKDPTKYLLFREEKEGNSSCLNQIFETNDGAYAKGHEVMFGGGE